MKGKHQGNTMLESELIAAPGGDRVLRKPRDLLRPPAFSANHSISHDTHNIHTTHDSRIRFHLATCSIRQIHFEAIEYSQVQASGNARNAGKGIAIPIAGQIHAKARFQRHQESESMLQRFFLAAQMCGRGFLLARTAIPPHWSSARLRRTRQTRPTVQAGL